MTENDRIPARVMERSVAPRPHPRAVSRLRAAESSALGYRPAAMLSIAHSAPVTALLTASLLLAPTVPCEPPVAPTAAEPPAVDASAARVDAFLTELEKSGATIDTLSGTLSLEKYDALLEESERRFGRLVVDRHEGKRRFAIYFEEFIDGSGRADRSVTHWIFSDGWLCEQDHRNKSFTKRQIVAPGETLDPLALGEGPIPMPIGQKKAEVLARFTVTEHEIPLDIPMLGSLKNVAALKLVPKDGTPMAKDTASVELFYDRTSLAPVGVVIREKSGNRTVARIGKPVVNGEVKAEDRALLEIPSPDPKEWAIDVRPWRKSDG
jgi:hypothetical protein